MSKTRLIDAVKELDFATIKTLLAAQPALLGVTDRQGRTLLHLACSVPCAELKIPESLSARVVTLLLDRGLDVNSPLLLDGCPCNSVWFAVARGRNQTLVKLLVKRGARPEGLFAAGWYDDTRMIDLLVRLGATVDEVVKDETPFLLCWKSRKFEGAKCLVRNGADPNFQDSKGKTALHYGLEKQFDPALLSFLVKQGASPDLEDRDGVSPRALAARKRDKAFLQALA